MDRPRDTDLRGGTRALSLFRRPFDLPVILDHRDIGDRDGEDFGI